MFKLVVAISTLTIMVSCALDGQAQNNLRVSTDERRFSSPVSEQTYKILMAEFYFKQHKYAMATDHFLDVALKNDDPYIAERATKTAVFSGDVDKALKAAERWRALDKDSSKARQYVALLLLHKKQYSNAADELYKLEQQIDLENRTLPVPDSSRLQLSPGHRLVVEMLKRDNNPNKVFETYKSYVEKYHKDLHAAYFALAGFAMADSRHEDALAAADRASKTSDKAVYRKSRLIYINALSELDRGVEAADELSKLIDESADERTKQIYARLLASLGQEDEALSVLGHIYSNNSKNISALRDMIALHIEKNNLDKSEALVKLLMSNDSQNTTAHYFYGRISELREQPAKAVEHYLQALEARTYYIDVRGRLVELMARAGNINEALEFLHVEQEKTVSDTDLVDLYQMESSLLDRTNRLEEALAVIKKASDLLPHYSDKLQYSSALLYERLGDLAAAERVLKSIIEQDSNNSNALNALGYMLLINNTDGSKLDEARSYIEQAYELKSDDPAIIDSLGWVHYKQGNYDQAEEYLRLAYRDLKDPEVAGHLIEVLTKKGDLDEAKKVLKEMIERHPDDPRLMKVKDKIIGMHDSQER